MKTLLSTLLLVAGCQVEMPSAHDKSVLKLGSKAGNKLIKKLSKDLLPKVKRLTKSTASESDYDELAALLKGGKTKSKAAARAFRLLVEEPLVKVDTSIKSLRSLPKANPLTAKSEKLMLTTLGKKLTALENASAAHHRALQALKKRGIDTKSLRVDIEAQQARRWKAVLKNNYPDQFDKFASLSLSVNRTADVLTGVVVVTLPISLKEFLAAEQD